MRHLLLLAALLPAVPAQAEGDLRGPLLAYLRAWDCEMPTDALAYLATAVLDHGEAESDAALRALLDGGEARIDDATGWLVLAPVLCEPSPDGAVSSATSWIEQWLLEAEACRLPFATAARLADEVGLATDAFDTAAASLVESGMVRLDGPDLVHAVACEPPPPPGEPLERVAGLDVVGLRSALALHLMGDGDCLVTAANRDAVIDAVARAALPMAGLADPVPPDAMAALRARVAEVLDNPGPAYEIDATTGDLAMVHCTP